MEDWDIERIITDYANAAEGMQAANLDGIELQAYGHLMDQFWSPLTNTLDAPYGGSMRNWLRFSNDVLRAIRKRVGNEFIVGIRYTADEMAKGGLTAKDTIKILKQLKKDGLVDFLNVI
jgi:2,4-dienoyl-CoA reductase-like NADH-dependent reductase (Old Yellow Enzyme family)